MSERSGDQNEHPEHTDGLSRERILNTADLLNGGAEIKEGRLELTETQVEAARAEMNGAALDAERQAAEERVSEIEAGLKGKSLGEKVEFVRTGLKEIEELLHAEPQASTPEDLKEKKDALESAFVKLVRANARITGDGVGNGHGVNHDGSPIDTRFVSSLYVNSLTRYVGDELTKGRNLDDIRAHNNSDAAQYSAAVWELGVRDRIRRSDEDIMGDAYASEAWNEVVRSFQGERSTHEQATDEHRTWVMLSGLEDEYNWQMARSDVRDIEPM